MWVEDFAEQDSFILGTVVELLETLLHSQRFWQLLKQAPMTTARLLNLSKRPTINVLVKTKIVQLVSMAQRPQYAPPSQTPLPYYGGSRPTEEYKQPSYALDPIYNGLGNQPSKSYNERVA